MTEYVESRGTIRDYAVELREALDAHGRHTGEYVWVCPALHLRAPSVRALTAAIRRLTA